MTAKNSTKKTTARKKPTAAKKKANRAKAAATKASKPQQQNTNVAGELRELHGCAIEMVRAATEVSQIFRNQEFIDKLADDRPVRAAGVALGNHLKSMLNQLDILNAKQTSILDMEDEVARNLEAIMLGENYRDWIYQYTNVVEPIVNEINGFIEQVNALEAPSANNTQAPAAPAQQAAPAQPPKKKLDLMAMATGGKK